MNVNYEIIRDEIWRTEESANIKFNNYYGLTTEQVKNMPLEETKDGVCSRVIGHLLEADEEYIYGFMYNLSDLCDDKKESFSMEIHYND